MEDPPAAPARAPRLVRVRVKVRVRVRIRVRVRLGGGVRVRVITIARREDEMVRRNVTWH